MIHRPTLAQSAATLRAAVQSDRAPFWLPDSLHALIVACLLRIFGRLEQMIALWESGHLPPPHPRRATTTPRPPSNAALDGIVPVRPPRRRGARRARKASDETIQAQSGILVATARPDAGISRRDPPCVVIACCVSRAPARAPPGPDPGTDAPPTHAHNVT